ncbi:MAG: hypothetical protein GY796_32365 [Chloroflexi bacterium]|nr:hypothetical protein [Chloroflexota bacterium]
MTTNPESIINKRYILQAKLGEGGMGVVHRKPENVLQVQAYSFLQTRVVKIRNETMIHYLCLENLSEHRKIMKLLLHRGQVQ